MLGRYELVGNQRSDLYKQVGARLRLVSSGPGWSMIGGSPDEYAAKITKKLDGFLEEVKNIKDLSNFDLTDIRNAQQDGMISETTLYGLIVRARTAVGINESLYR